MKKLIIICIILFTVTDAQAQTGVPTLKGTVIVSIKNGTIDCDIVMEDIPEIKNYYLRLNAGMNLAYIRNEKNNYSFAYDRDYNDTSGGESFGYYLMNNTGKFLPHTLRFKYSGKFPVITDTLQASHDDWRGNIAFNGYSLRTDGTQAAWYPTLKDIDADKNYDHVKYDLKIICNDCSEIFMNGAIPVQGNSAHFSDTTPTELAMYMGNYAIKNIGNTYFLNPDITDAQLQDFGTLTNKIKDYYARKMNIPYRYNITYINSTPVSKYNAWMFVSYPTIMFVGWGDYGMKGMLHGTRTWEHKASVAHELGHYYFGTLGNFNTPMRRVLDESFAEYLSLKAAKDVIKDTAYTALMHKKEKILKDFNPRPLSQIKNEKDFGNDELYLYYSTPVIWLAIEKEIGDKAMWKWMQNIVNTTATFTDYTFMQQTLKKAISNDKKYEQVKAKYLESDNALKNAFLTIGTP